jgi:hypothetical protein
MQITEDTVTYVSKRSLRFVLLQNKLNLMGKHLQLQVGVVKASADAEMLADSKVCHRRWRGWRTSTILGEGTLGTTWTRGP